MTIPQLGTLSHVELREVWPHEAHSFTPWLAANLTQLSDLVGIPLELEGTEVAVDLFSADILARNPIDDSLVLIENQLEKSNHTHLGQVMTYLAGLDVRTIIWIARDFSESHLSAFRWLNDNTEESFAFFAIRVSAVKIGDSIPAPQFEILSRPNEWERQLHSIAQGAQSEIGKLRTDFWSHFIRRHPSEAQYGPANGASARWRTLKDQNLVISLFIAREYVGLFVRGLMNADPTLVFERLQTKHDELMVKTGAILRPHSEGQFLISKQAGDTRDPSTWDTLCDWLHATSEKYESMLKEAFPLQV